MRLNRTLLRMLSASLNSPETTSVDELSPILFMLDDIHDDENFRMAHPNLQGCRNEVREAIEVRISLHWRCEVRDCRHEADG